MKNKLLKRLLTVLAFSSLLYGCKKDKDQVKLPPPVLNSPELMTSMVLQFKDSANTTNMFTAEYRDPDGPGGNPATKFDTIKLSSNTTYYVSVALLDETKSPVDSISPKIWEERNDHQFFFTHSGAPIITSYLDTDGNGLPVGLSTKWRAGNAGAGSSRIILKHQPDVKNGTQAPGETDIDVTFQAKIQ